jgi:hypothetical protein
MAEDLTKMWRNLSLTEAEDEEMEVLQEAMNGTVSRGTFCLVGKMIADRYVSKETIKYFLLRWWTPQGKITLKVLGENLFIIEFEKVEDKYQVLEWRPWVFDGNLFSVADFDGVAQLSTIEFEKVALWVRMLNLPLACMNAEIGKMIGSSIGQVEEVDTDEDGVGWGKFLRVRIRVDLTKPLMRGKRLKVQGVSMWIDFQYERLPRFCFSCGVVQHGPTGCKKRFNPPSQGGDEEYGQWLRAPRPGKRVGGGNDWERGKVGAAQSFNGGRYGRRKVKQHHQGNSGGHSADAAATPTGADWAERQAEDSFLSGDEARVTAKGRKANEFNAGEENQEIPQNKNVVHNGTQMSDVGVGPFGGRCWSNTQKVRAEQESKDMEDSVTGKNGKINGLNSPSGNQGNLESNLGMSFQKELQRQKESENSQNMNWKGKNKDVEGGSYEEKEKTAKCMEGNFFQNARGVFFMGGKIKEGMHVDKGQVDLSGLMAGVGLHNGLDKEEGAKNVDCETQGKAGIGLASNSQTTFSWKRRARAGQVTSQNNPSEQLSGKRKNVAPGQNISKKNQEKKVRRQEACEDGNEAKSGSGMAGVGAQPRPPK